MELYTDGTKIVEAILPDNRETLIELVLFMQKKSYINFHLEYKTFDEMIEEALTKGYICYRCPGYDCSSYIDCFFMFYRPDHINTMPAREFKQFYVKADIESLQRDINYLKQ